MSTLFAFGWPGLPEMLIVGLVVLVLFGTRLPSVMRSLGVGITEFRKGIRGEIDEDGKKLLEEDTESNPDSSQTATSDKSQATTPEKTSTTTA